MSKTKQKIWTSKELRQSFINFFKERDHPIIKSSSVVPKDDPTLLFTNSGMVQFKTRFLNQPSIFSDINRACSIQHCIRAGGKHNDLDDVGKDTYHHTFFEMMGNWSFGDYGKEMAIKYAWEYLTEVLGLEKERIYATYFVPDSNYKDIPEDSESKEIWSKYLPAERILPFSKENFWEMGNVGPCGPCTEIHYDMSGTRLRSQKVNRDDPTLIEIWNLVFMQFYRNEDNSLKHLDNLSVDTGMGFERLLGILNHASNYETDLFIPLFNMTNLTYTPDNLFNKISESSEDEKSNQLTDNVALRIIADHSRTIAICLYNNLKFSPDGPGYVLRRITRRMIRVAEEKNIDNLTQIIQEAGRILELDLKPDMIEVYEKEANQFNKTLRKGLKLFNSLQNVTAEEVFKLKDTYGFPIDLTEQMCLEKGIKFDKQKVEQLIEEAIEKSKQKKKPASG
ncbi:alanine-tRNA synthetase [Pseudoloma neurophilia]|uniref:alanine--tRNA ligase n=1 Tax=Pseudoloma neurophilia TaxID=146866 RepID=A0A0R0LZU5_9MICR|nr:alanine-tRNA synthetase [Pseudoloma neurophilia]